MRLHQKVIGVMADGKTINRLRDQGLSWSEIAARFAGNTEVKLTCTEAGWLAENGFAFWVHRRRRMLIGARLETIARLSDLSARVGFDGKGNTLGFRKPGFGRIAEKVDWLGPFIRSRFLKRERKGGCDVGNIFDKGRDRQSSQG